MTTSAAWITAQNSPYGHGHTSNEPILFNDFIAVFGTCWLIFAVTVREHGLKKTVVRRKRQLIRLDERQNRFSGKFFKCFPHAKLFRPEPV